MLLHGSLARLTVSTSPSKDLLVPKDLNTSLRFGFLIHDVSRMRRIVIDRTLKPLGLTRSQWWFMAFLSRRDGMTQTALAVDLDLTKVAIGGLVNRLEATGLVERRPDAVDARARRIFLTRAGLKLITNIRAEVDRVEREILRGVDVDELNAAAAALHKIKETLIEMIGVDDAAVDDGVDDV
jgi:DNA-binding MarR family transcriptional regulator